MAFGQKNRYINLLKFLRILHFFELFSPFKLLLEIIMYDAIRKTIENVFSLIKLFASCVLVAHFAACAWVFIGKSPEQGENGWITVLENGVYDGDELIQPADPQW